MAGAESNISNRILKAASRAGARLFRQNVGQAWTGDAVKLPNGDLLLRNPRPVRMGLCTGSSDLIGWKPVTVTPEMVGQVIAAFTAVVVKSKSGRLRPEQQHFIDVVREAGGIAGVARHEDEALQLLNGPPSG
jgi:hypothetical protein